MTSRSPAGDCVDMRRSPQKIEGPAPMTWAKIGGERPLSRLPPKQKLTFSHQPRRSPNRKQWMASAKSPRERRHLASAVGQDEVGPCQGRVNISAQILLAELL